MQSALISSSLSPSLKYSFSGSGLRLTKGSTAMEVAEDGSATGTGVVSGRVVPAYAPSASANSAAVAKRSAGELLTYRSTTVELGRTIKNYRTRRLCTLHPQASLHTQ